MVQGVPLGGVLEAEEGFDCGEGNGFEGGGVRISEALLGYTLIFASGVAGWALSFGGVEWDFMFAFHRFECIMI